jgi:pimeloyl-ACP methyl ester carboxylesterase
MPSYYQNAIDLPAGQISFREAGQGKTLVFAHGYLANGRLWDGVVDRLAERYHCIVPDWPMGSHPVAMNSDADLSTPGIAAIVADFLDALDLDDVTIVANDSGGAMSQVLVTEHPERIGRLVLTNCDSHENFPPGHLKALPMIAKLPGGTTMIIGPMRFGPMARSTFRPFTKAPMPADLISSWVEPALRNRDVRRDLRKVTIGMNKRYTLAAAKKLKSFAGPMLIAWAPEDDTFPIAYAERLASEAADARIVQIADAKTFVPLDQPQRLADEIATFVDTDRGEALPSPSDPSHPVPRSVQ